MMRPNLRARMPSMTWRDMLKTQSRSVPIDLVPLLLRHPVEHGVARDAGVVDQHVDGAEFLGDLGAARFAGGVVADVPLVDRDARLDLELLRGGVVAGVVGGDAIAVVLERDGNGVADAARASRHEGDTCHVESPSNGFLLV